MTLPLATLLQSQHERQSSKTRIERNSQPTRKRGGSGASGTRPLVEFMRRLANRQGTVMPDSDALYRLEAELSNLTPAPKRRSGGLHHARD